MSCVIILAPNRSGSSLVASMLDSMGVDMGLAERGRFLEGVDAPQIRMQYEDIRAHPQESAERLGEFLGLDPGRHKTVQVPASDLTTVLDMSSGQIAAYKNALASNLNTQGEAVVGWSQAQLEALMDANDLSAYEADRANTYIIDVAGSYPVDFSM